MRYIGSLLVLGVSTALMMAVWKMDGDQISMILAFLSGAIVFGIVLTFLGMMMIRADVAKTQALASRPPAPAQPPVIVMHGGRALPDYGGARAIPERQVAQRQPAQRQPAQRQAQPAGRPRQWGYVDHE